MKKFSLDQLTFAFSLNASLLRVGFENCAKKITSVLSDVCLGFCMGEA